VRSTSHGVLVFSPEAELLLCHATGTRHWDIPKGMANEGEESSDAARREAREECGLELDAVSLLPLGRFAYRPQKDLALHAALVERIDPSRCMCSTVFSDRWGRVRPEMDAFRWARLDEVPALCAKSMVEVLTRKVALAEVFAQLQAGRGRALDRA